MKRTPLVLGAMLAFLLTLGMVALAQTGSGEEDEEPQIAFRIESEIGRALPRSIVYDPAQERMAVIDAYNRLLIIDANTYETQHVLYERGDYNDLLFSNDGRYLALAIESRIELYDADTGALVADLVDLGQAIRIQGPLSFSRDDDLMVFRGVYPAPRSIRLTENQTVVVPWIWNLPAAREEADSTFPGNVEAWQFFDYRNGFELGPENRIVAALPSRLQVLDAYSLDVLFEIPTDRYEQDPLTVWFSLQDDQIYVRPVNENSFIQVDTQDGVLVELPLDEWLTETDLDLVGGVELGSQARFIGPPESRRTNPLLEVLLGENYVRYEAYRLRSLTITLVDLVIPPAATQENVAALLFIFDENAREGRFVLSRQFNVEQMLLGPDNERLLVRRNEGGDERVIQYELSSGERINSFIPALRDIGSYSRNRRNRVLAYDDAGEVIISDFQRINAATTEVLAEDLRYSRRFDRFFFTEDSERIVTLAGTEWREWDVDTGAVLRREVLNLRGSIFATSRDGFRYLTRYADRNGNGVEVIDLETNERTNVNFVTFQGRDIQQMIPNRAWTHFFVIYEPNSYGQYFPGNEIAVYSLANGLEWFMAGDDLPPAENRRYGWVDNENVYVYGDGDIDGQPSRIYGVDYAPNGLPECVVDAFPEQMDTYVDLWERLVYRLRPDRLAALSELICSDLPDDPDAVQELLLPTPTMPPVTPTPITIPGVPVCLTARYPDEAEDYAELWEELTVDLSAAEINELEDLLCEGIGEFDLNTGPGADFRQTTMIIDADTGERATGAFEEREVVTRPIFPLQNLFEETENRALGTAILAPNEEIIAASSLPGELVVYRILVSYQGLLDDITATAVTRLEEQNLIGVLPSATPTYNAIGTPRPTLTPTVTPTPIPRPEDRVDQPQLSEVVDVCPAETLYTVDNPPDGYNPTGQIVAPVLGDTLWTINPLTGDRGPNENVPQCGSITCNFSPDRSWILATTLDLIYVVRPDNTDQRVLYDFEEDENIPSDLRWFGPETLEYSVTVVVEENGEEVRKTALQRDILGVFPDPDPWIPEISINTLPTTIVSRQPGGDYLIARTTFSTGVGPGYKYYLYNIETEEAIYFARLTDYPADELRVAWHPLGERVFYYYPPPPGSRPVWYQIDLPSEENRLLDYLPSGVWSNDARYRVFNTNRRTQPIAVWDSETGLTRTYCLPETGARFYEGTFTWSPDSRYIALRAPLPADENVEGVGEHTMILDIETGTVVDLTTGALDPVMWARSTGGYTEEN